MRLTRFPRAKLISGLTPLEPMPNLTRYLGGPPLWVKRDDSTGLGGGGNKVRKLEFLVGEALAAGADTLITTGALQSNHCRQTAAAAAKLGLRCTLLLQHRVAQDSVEYRASGNVLLDRLFGAELEVLPPGTDMATQLLDRAERMFLAGWQPYQIPLGGSNRVGALGYAACAFELLQQSYELGVDLNWVVHASSSGGTQTGLVSGFAGANAAVEVLGVAVSGGEAENLAMLGELAEATADFLGIPPAAVKSRLQIDNRHVGPGYGQLTPETVEAIEIAARTEGLVLDPVYSGKAMAGLIANIRAGRFDAEHNVVFLHTGGAPGLFAYREAFSAPAV